MKASLVAALGAGVAIPACGLFLRYRRDLKAARARLAAVERHVIATRWGAVEYAERGCGDPVLVVHGIFHNCVGGLLSVRDLLADRRVIAPSRFGYLGSSMPPNATPAAQADALAALLDALDLDQIDVIGESAGATSALQLALRHPERVKHLAVLVGNLPGSPTAVVQPSLAKLFNRQLPIADVNDYKLEAIDVPTLIVHTKDDQVASHEASQRAAERIPGARLVSLESAGHLMLDQTKIIPRRAHHFLGREEGAPRGAFGRLSAGGRRMSCFPHSS
jgi:pimeloyl-ACP methyl ester carboxylesterase